MGVRRDVLKVAVQQNYYTPNQRPQQSRNLNPRNTSSGNPNQVVGIPTVGGAPVQSAAMYSHPNMTISSSPVYVQNQVSGIHANPHQQTVYSMNNQMPLQV
ncbi:hypothetical protein QAD02_007292 [Eretmocerus hayati]|uniref:Uncharacterized protein n=1 Tax=Eretmocerus hayati TaxID=131215 RepID=A0ACC2N378_9HYME|nr:hypothetical protein QAD02_007292 [Eretmocerus hayati]